MERRTAHHHLFGEFMGRMEVHVISLLFFHCTATVFFAIKDALHSARVENLGVDAAHRPFTFHSPATSERIRMAACDDLTETFMKPDTKVERGQFQTLGSF